MNFEKYSITRSLGRLVLKLEDIISRYPFPRMKRVREISNYSCGPATLEMLLSFVDVKASQKKLIASIRAQNQIKLYGLTITQMAKAAKAAGKGKITFWKKQFSSINDLELVLNTYKFPVGVEWQGDFYEREDEDKGHYSVVTKIGKFKNIRISDPYFNSYFDYGNLDRGYDVNEFYKKWWDDNEILVSGTSRRRKVTDTRMMFVVTPKEASWPKKLGMKKV